MKKPIENEVENQSEDQGKSKPGPKPGPKPGSSGSEEVIELKIHLDKAEKDIVHKLKTMKNTPKIVTISVAKSGLVDPESRSRLENDLRNSNCYPKGGISWVYK